MPEHHFYLKANWPGLRNDVGNIKVGNLESDVSIPVEMNGPGVGTNPDEMLLGAAATCYINTLAAIMENSHLEKENLIMESVGIVEESKSVLTYKKIIHRPYILLKPDASERDVKFALRLAKKAETSCMISRAIQGNVEIELEAKVEISAN